MSQGEESKPADVAEWGFGVCVCGATFTLKSAYLEHKARCPIALTTSPAIADSPPLLGIVKHDQ